MSGAAPKVSQESFHGWLGSLAVSLPQEPCGEDPRYWDEFALLKGEIEKLQGADFHKVWDLGRELLAGRTRDLRIAGYLVLAGMFTGGMSRLLESVRGYRLLLETFGQQCHPRQSAPRTAALRWLNQARVESFARRFAAGATPDDLKALREEIDGINSLVRREIGEEAPVWTVLNSWIQEELRNASPPVQAMAPAVAEAPFTPVPSASTPPAENTPAGSPAVDSERELAAATRHIRDYLRRNKEDLRGVFFARAFRWGGLSLPPHQEGRTRISPLRKSGWAEAEKGRASGDWEKVLQTCENLFLEPGGQFDLDLQALAVEAAKAQGRRDLADFIAGQTALLVRRFPELPRLSFEDGRPFASAATRQWLQSLNREPRETQEDKGSKVAARMEEAREVLRGGSLEEGLGFLDDFPVGGEKQRLELRLARARLCLEGGRPEIALPLLEDLHETVLAQSLHLWEKPLALAIWSALLQTCRALPSQGRDDLKGLAARIEGLICRTDPAAATGLL